MNVILMKTGAVMAVVLLAAALLFPLGWIVWDSLQHGVQL